MEESELSQIFGEHRDRLRRLVELRMDQRLAGRVDASDVIQESFLEAAKRHEEFLRKDASVSVYVWLRFLTVQKLLQFHRRHLNVKARDANRELAFGANSASVSSIHLAANLADSITSPSQALAREETQARLHETLENMSAPDREVLALRHFEQLTNAEAAEVLGISEDACYRRYIRALKRIRKSIDLES